PAMILPEKLPHKSIGFARGSSIANGDRTDVVFLNEAIQPTFRPSNIPARLGRINRGLLEKFSRFIDNCNFAASAETRVDPNNADEACRRRQQQIGEVGIKYLDGLRIRSLLKLRTYFRLQARIQKSLVSVLDCNLKRCGKNRLRVLDNSCRN